MLIQNTIRNILHENLITFRDTSEIFELKGDFLKVITNKIFNADLASLQDKKLMYDFAKEMNFDVKGQGTKSTRDRILLNLLKSPAIMASGISNTIFLPIDLEEICDRISLLLQEERTGYNSNIVNEELIATVDKLLEYKCSSRKQHNQKFNNCNLLHK